MNYDSNRGTAHQRGYDTAWRKFRLMYLNRHPLCLSCHDLGRLVPATEIHHIKELSAGGDKYDDSNLLPLCHSCHSATTAAGGYGKKGKVKVKSACDTNGLPLDRRHHWR